MPKSAIRVLPGIAAGMALLSAAASAEPGQQPGQQYDMQPQYIRLARPAASPEYGQASWYGGRHNGRLTSSGEVFNQEAMTAAHHRLPLGSRVRVTMADTGNSVVVTINDRQPDHGRRIIDLSRGAAARLGLLDRGTAMVTLDNVSEDDPVGVAEAADDPAEAGVSPPPRGPRRMRRGGQAAAADLR